VPLPGVIAGFNLALRALTSPRGAARGQTPVYPPICAPAGNHGLTRDEHALTRAPTAATRWTSTRSRGRCVTHRRIPALQPPQPVGAFERAELEAWRPPRATRRLDHRRRDPRRSPARRPPARADRHALAGDRGAHAQPSWRRARRSTCPLKCAVAIIPNATLRERLAAAVADLVPKINVLATPPPSRLPQGDPWLEALFALPRGEPHRSRPTTCRAACPASPWRRRGDLSRVARLPRDRIADPFTFSSIARRSRSTTAAYFGPGGEASSA